MASPSAQIPGAIPTESFSPSMPLFARGPSVFFTTAAVVFALLILEQAIYRSKKASLPGARWTIPIIGKFADSLNPTLEGYKKQWAMGELSAISVFNMSVYPSHRLIRSCRMSRSPDLGDSEADPPFQIHCHGLHKPIR